MLTNLALEWISRYGAPALCGLLMLGIVGLPVPDETLLCFAGFLVGRGVLEFLPTLLSAFTGSSIGITLSFLLGHLFGTALLGKYGHVFHVSDKEILIVNNWFNRWGKWSLTAGYFLPGIRHLVAFIAGASRLQPTIFAMFAYSGAALWTASFLSLGYYVGEDWAVILSAVHRHLLVVTVASTTVLAGYLAINVLKKIIR